MNNLVAIILAHCHPLPVHLSVIKYFFLGRRLFKLQKWCFFKTLFLMEWGMVVGGVEGRGMCACVEG